MELFIGTGNDDTLIGTEAADTIFGNAGDDFVIGGAGDDLIEGGDGNDFLRGDEGDDLVRGGAGDDQISDGQGSDTLVGGDGFDFLRFRGGEGATEAGVVVNLAEGFAIDLFGDVNRISGFEEVDGGAGRAIIIGDDADNRLFAGDAEGGFVASGGGSDTLWGSGELFGGAGFDRINGFGRDDRLGGGEDGDFIEGDAGSDLIWGGGGDDFLVGGKTLEFGGAFGDLADPEGDDTLLGGVGDDTLVASSITGPGSINDVEAPDLIESRDSNSVLFGGQGNDLLIGGDGADSLYGGAGDDTIFGGVGSQFADGPDLFFFAGDHGDDVVLGFDASQDRLYLVNAVTDFTDLASVQTAATETTIGERTGLLIDTGGGNSIFLAGIQAIDLTENALVL